METKGSILQGFKNLSSLKDDPRFRQYFIGNVHAIQSIHKQMASIDPNDIVGVARLQGQLMICQARQDEYEICEKKVFDLEKAMTTVVKKKHETGNVPPRQEK